MKKCPFPPPPFSTGRLRRLKPWQAACLAVLLIGVVGCQNPPEQDPSDVGPSVVGEYIDQNLQGEVRGVVGVPLYSISPELVAHGLEGQAGFLLLSPRDPQAAVVVLAPDTNAEELAQRPSGLVSIDGMVEGELPIETAEYLDENYPIVLAKNGERPLLLRADKIETAVIEGEANGEHSE